MSSYESTVIMQVVNHQYPSIDWPVSPTASKATHKHITVALTLIATYFESHDFSMRWF